MPGSPRTPRHSRNSSAIDSFAGSPQIRRFSRSSAQDAITAFNHSPNQHDVLDLSVLGGGGSGANGMGNLADELADAFSDSGEEGDDYDAELQEFEKLAGQAGHNEAPRGSSANDDTRKVEGDAGLLSPRPKGHQRKTSLYDGSDYGSDSDLDIAGIPPSLMAKIDAVENLTIRGTDNYGGTADDVLKRVIQELRDLGSQSSVEGSASRLITAHSALTTHLAHQTRQLHNLTFPLLSPLAPAPDAETIDTLLPLLVSLTEDMPRPSTSAFNSLTALHSITSELIQSLSYLSDTLHMSRQTTAAASRRLKSAKELVAEMRKEDDLREQGEQWLTRGNWGERLEKRECASVCGEVIGGFEEVCNGWRERLLAQAESQA
ncbi:wd domain-containing [Trichoderma arundinaceum]|uniref:Wd domain-containing n=1 Tax=Trichoderma arundinaceum TaxID=490622 RepID=A0A395NRV8_TRIAR|nr:wd domain-containing [Trichoderma arundinaceum]